MWPYYVLVWLAFGLAFWLDFHRFNDWPRYWRARNAIEEGWREEILVVIPKAIVGGPLWWIALLLYRTIRR